MKYTKEDIEKLREKPYKDLTPKERSLVNLNPIKPGEARNPNGVKKGTIQWKTHFKRLMEDPDFLSTIISHLPKEWDDIVDGVPADVIAAAVVANVVKESAKTIQDNKPLSKDLRESINLLNKLGYGENQNVEIENPESLFTDTKLEISVVEPKQKQ